MSKMAVIDAQGAPCGDMDIPEELLVLKSGDQAVHDVVTAHRAGRRAGTASTLTKAGVAASGKKPWRQKGLGRARAGYRGSPIWRGGGVVFGPQPRSYAKSVNRKIARLAFRRVLSERIDSGALRVIESLELPDARTRSFAALLARLKLSGKLLVVVREPGAELKRASRNLPGVELARAADVGTYQLLCYPVVLAERAAMEIMLERLRRNDKKAVAEK